MINSFKDRLLNAHKICTTAAPNSMFSIKNPEEETPECPGLRFRVSYRFMHHAMKMIKHGLQKHDPVSHLASGDMLTKGLKVSCK